jgi:hypothetical protein
MTGPRNRKDSSWNSVECSWHSSGIQFLPQIEITIEIERVNLSPSKRQEACLSHGSSSLRAYPLDWLRAHQRLPALPSPLPAGSHLYQLPPSFQIDPRTQCEPGQCCSGDLGPRTDPRKELARKEGGIIGPEVHLGDISWNWLHSKALAADLTPCF